MGANKIFGILIQSIHTTKNFKSRFDNESIVNITQQELDELLSASKVLEERNTMMCGYIRILQLDNLIFIQEQTDKRELIIRRSGSLEQAHSFVDQRIEIYDKMWDGCGCKIRYFE